jgi:hypothetical protein
VFAVMRSSKSTPTAAVAEVADKVERADVERDGSITQIRATLGELVKWSKDHAGEACPQIKARDGWGHPLVVTCTDQPSDQMFGVTSAGADGVVGSRDDLVSWRLDAETIEIARGARWTEKTVEPPKPVAKAKPKPKVEPSTPRMLRKKKQPEPALNGTTLGDDGIPTSR